MNKQELYQIAFSIINHKKLRNFGTSGHVVIWADKKNRSDKTSCIKTLS